MLPVKSNLLKRNITISVSLCNKCNRYEDEIHLLLNCPYAAKAWSLAPVLFKSQFAIINSPKKLLHELLRLVNLPPSGTPLYPWLMWNLWKARNQLIFEDPSLSEEELVVNSIREWQQAQLHLPKQPKPGVTYRTCLTIPEASNGFIDAAWKGGLG